MSSTPPYDLRSEAGATTGFSSPSLTSESDYNTLEAYVKVGEKKWLSIVWEMCWVVLTNSAVEVYQDNPLKVRDEA